MATKKIPAYVLIACDLYLQDKININDIAKKYNKTVRQIQWILAKSVKNRLPELWKHINAKLHNKPISREMQYINVMANMLVHNWGIPNLIYNLKKTDKQVYDAIRYAQKKFPTVSKIITL